MAITIAKRILSGSTDGFPINVSSTSVSGTLVHLGSTSTNVLDEMWVYATNSSTNTVTCWVEYGNAGSASQRMTFDLASTEIPELIIPGFLLQGRSATGISINVGASTSNVINLYGYVNRITQ